MLSKSCELLSKDNLDQREIEELECYFDSMSYTYSNQNICNKCIVELIIENFDKIHELYINNTIKILIKRFGIICIKNATFGNNEYLEMNNDNYFTIKKVLTYIRNHL